MVCARSGGTGGHGASQCGVCIGAAACELFALGAGTKAPLTRDIVALGRVSHWGDTRRTRTDLLPRLICPTFAAGRRLC
jgi:hypothetical protein